MNDLLNTSEGQPIAVGVIFSRDRAMQLDATLASLHRHCTDVHCLDLHVLYAASTYRLARQYLELRRHWEGILRLTFHLEEDFRKDLLGILGLATDHDDSFRAWRRRILRRLSLNTRRDPPTPVSWTAILFLVDDNIFVRDFSLGAPVQALLDAPTSIGFSLRLGRNTTTCYALDRPQALPTLSQVAEGILGFDWTRADSDFGYPLEVSSSVYAADTIAPLLLTEDYSNPNTLETTLAMAASRFRRHRSKPTLLCFEESVAFCNAVNKVQSTYANRSGEKPELSSAALADRFAAGLRIDTEAFSGFRPNACHGEVPFQFAAARVEAADTLEQPPDS